MTCEQLFGKFKFLSVSTRKLKDFLPDNIRPSTFSMVCGPPTAFHQVQIAQPFQLENYKKFLFHVLSHKDHFSTFIRTAPHNGFQCGLGAKDHIGGLWFRLDPFLANKKALWPIQVCGHFMCGYFFDHRYFDHRFDLTGFPIFKSS